MIDFDYGAILSCIESKLALMGSEDKLDGLEVTEVQVGRARENREIVVKEMASMQHQVVGQTLRIQSPKLPVLMWYVFSIL